MTDDELKRTLEEAAEKGAEKALRKLTGQVYQDVGKTVVKRFLEVIGMLIVAVIIYAVQKGWIS